MEHVELNNVLMAAKGWGVMTDPDATSLSVSERATPVMGVTVAEGHCSIDGTEYDEGSSVDLTIEAAHATLHRKDLITYDPTTGNPVVTKGTDHAGGTGDPIYPPNIPAGDILLAIVAVDAAVTTIVDADITDTRAFVEEAYVYSTKTSDTLRKSEDAAVNIQNSVYAIKKTITVPSGIVSGTMKLMWDMERGDAGDTVYARVYKNGVFAEGSWATDSATYETTSFALAGCGPGDALELYMKQDGPGIARVRNYRVYCDYTKTRLRNSDPTWS